MPDIEITKSIIVGNQVYIGNNVTILPGVSIGNNIIIGAAVVVSNYIPDNSIVVDVPARVIKSVDDYMGNIKEFLHLEYLREKEKMRH